jgi:hypothetical protein
MAIDGYSIVAMVILLMAIGAYFINAFEWLIY